jgi:hypothetical protein
VKEEERERTLCKVVRWKRWKRKKGTTRAKKRQIAKTLVGPCMYHLGVRQGKPVRTTDYGSIRSLGSSRFYVGRQDR